MKSIMYSGRWGLRVRNFIISVVLVFLLGGGSSVHGAGENMRLVLKDTKTYNTGTELIEEGSWTTVSGKKYLAVGGNGGGKIEIYEWNSDSESLILRNNSQNYVTGLSINTLEWNGEYLAVGGSKASDEKTKVELYKWDSTTNVLQFKNSRDYSFSNVAAIQALAWNGDYLAVGGFQNSSTRKAWIKIYKREGDTLSAEKASVLFNDPTGYRTIYDLAWNGNLLAVCGQDGDVELFEWDGGNETLAPSVAGTDYGGNAFTLAWNGNYLAVGGADKTVKIYEWSGGGLVLKKTLSVSAYTSQSVWEVSWSGNYLAVGVYHVSVPTRILIYEWDSSDSSLTLKTDSGDNYDGGSIDGFAWNDGYLAVVGGNKGKVEIYKWEIDPVWYGADIPGGSEKEIESGSSLDVDQDVDIEGTLNIRSNGTCNILANYILNNLGTISHSGILDILGELINNGTLTLNNGALAYLRRGGIFRERSGTTFTIGSGATYTVESGATLIIESGGTGQIDAGGTLIIEKGGTVIVQAGGTLTNNGSIIVYDNAVLDTREGTFTNNGNIDYRTTRKMRFHGKSAGLSSNSPLYLNTDITGWQGKLMVSDPATSIMGSGRIIFDGGLVESSLLEASLTGEYSAQNAQTDVVYLKGTNPIWPNRLRVQPGTTPQKIYVAYAHNWLEGQPLLSETITFTEPNSTLNIAVQNKLAKNINLNTGTLILQDDLELEDGVVLDRDHNGTPTSGTINLNGRTLHLAGDQTFWAGLLAFESANDIELHAKTSLSGTWTFTRANACGDPYDIEDVYLNGNGNILDITNAGRIYVTAGVHLHLADVHVKGLGNAVQYGKIFLEHTTDPTCTDAQLHLYNTEIEMASNYSVSSGGWYVEGADSTIITYGYSLQFVDDHDTNGTLTVDGVTLWYDTKNTEPTGSNIVPSSPDNENKYLVYLNGGVIKSEFTEGLEGLRFNAQTYDTGNPAPDDRARIYHSYDVTTLRQLVFYDGGMNPSVHEDMIFNGQGYYFYFPNDREPSDRIIEIDANVTVTMENVTLKNFYPDLVYFGDSNAELYFGDGVIIELASDTVIDDGDFPFKFCSTGITNGASIIGHGKTLDLDRQDAIEVCTNMTLTLKDITITGLGSHSAYPYEIRGLSPTSQVDLINTTFVIDDHFTFTEGNLNVFDDSIIKCAGEDKVFAWASPGEIAIHGCGKLLVDRGMTFSYDSQEPANDNLIIGDGGRFYLSGCTLLATETGLKLSGGSNSRMVIDDVVTFSALGRDADTAIIIDKDLPLEVLSDAAIDVFGPVVYE